MGLLVREWSCRVSLARCARKSVVLALLLGLALAGCRSLQLGSASIRSDGEWVTEGGDTRRSYAISRTIQPPLATVWEFKTTGGFGPASPLLLRNVVLVSTRKGEVQAIDIDSGKGQGVVGLGESIDGGAVIDRYGTLFVPVAWGRRGLYAFDLSTGTTRWRDKRVPVSAGLLLIDNRLIVADVQSLVSAYDPMSGEVLWERRLSENSAVLGAPVLADSGIVVVGTDSASLYALSLSDGSVIWEKSLPAPVYVTPGAGAGVVYVPTTRGQMVAVRGSDGHELFTLDVGNLEVRLSTPAISSQAVVVGASDGVLRAIHPETGAVKWEFEGREAVAAAPLIAGEVVYVGDMGKKFRAVSLANGELLWQTELSGRIKSAMAAGSGRLVVLAEPRSVFLFAESDAYAANE